MTALEVKGRARLDVNSSVCRSFARWRSISFDQQKLTTFFLYWRTCSLLTFCRSCLSTDKSLNKAIMSTPCFLLLSPSALKTLKNKTETLEIRWKQRPAAEYIVLDDKYAKEVGIIFFGIFEEQFPRPMQVRTSSLAPAKRVITLVRADIGAIRKILKWALSCCYGRGLSPFPFAQKENRYTLSYLDRQAAELLQISWLAEKVDERMQVLEDHFMHPADARLLVQQLPHTDPVFSRLVDHIAARPGRTCRSVVLCVTGRLDKLMQPKENDCPQTA